MQLVKSITPKKIKTLRTCFLAFLVLQSAFYTSVSAQDNSPYSRYGIGDLVSPTHISNRGMGGISAGQGDFLSINFNNPASYSSFQAWKEAKSKKLAVGRAILDIGINADSRTLQEPGNTKKFTASNLLFSYVQVGVPLKQNWGLTFGIRPVSRISYKIFTTEKLVNPLPPFNTIEKAENLYEGTGGSYLASAGTGFSLFNGEKHGLEHKLSWGLNAGYLFGEKDHSSRRILVNDTVAYYRANYETRTNFGNLYFNTGLQYKLPVSKKMVLTAGAYGSWGQTLKANQDIRRETFDYDPNTGDTVSIETVVLEKGKKGEIKMPASFTIGFALQKYAVPNKESGWLVGIDFSQQNWDKYRFYGQADAVKNKWELRVGGQFNPIPKKNYFSQVGYRLGFFTGPDYVSSGAKLNQTGATFGLALPIANYGRLSEQATVINLAFEYVKRGDNSNLLKENLFRLSVGFSLSDFWFKKRKYD